MAAAAVRGMLIGGVLYIIVILFGSLALPVPMLLLAAVRRRWGQLAILWSIHVALVCGVMLEVWALRRAGNPDWLYAQVHYILVNLAAAVSYVAWTIAALIKRPPAPPGFLVILKAAREPGSEDSRSDVGASTPDAGAKADSVIEPRKLG